MTEKKFFEEKHLPLLFLEVLEDTLSPTNPLKYSKKCSFKSLRTENTFEPINSLKNDEKKSFWREKTSVIVS
jgi:hypothetical protein